MATSFCRWCVAWLALAMAIACTTGLAGEDQATPTNLLKNPGFEATEARGFAADWGGGEFGKPGDNIQRDTQVKRSGDASLRLGFKVQFLTCVSEKMLLKPNTSYGFIWWVKTENMDPHCRAYAFLQLATKQAILGDCSQKVNADWTRFAAEYVTPGEEQWVQLVFATQQTEAPKTKKVPYAWFDDAMVTEGRISSHLPPTVCPLKHGAWEVMGDLTDEFDGNALDLKKWKVSEFAWNDVKTAYVARNVTVSDGRLHLAIKKEAVDGKPEITYTSGMLSTVAKARYGYFEASCRLTKCLANNAYWFYLADGDRGGLSEIDVFETSAAERTDMPGGVPDSARLANKVNTTLHIESPAGRYWCPGTKHWQAPVGLDKDFHRYGLEWDESHILVYFDGEMIQGFENTHHFHPLALLFNLTATYGGLPLDADLPSTFDVEYVRAWRRADVEDKRVWDFKFTLPDKDQQYRVRTTDNGTITVFRGGQRGYVKVDYLNADFFASQKDPIVRNTAEARDKSGKPVRFHLEWRPSALDADHNGYKLWRLYIEPALRQPQGSDETFTFAAENGREFQLTITY